MLVIPNFFVSRVTFLFHRLSTTQVYFCCHMCVLLGMCFKFQDILFVLVCTVNTQLEVSLYALFLGRA